MDIHAIIEVLRNKRPVFHSEADFQFALAWEIQLRYPTASVRLEYPPEGDPNKYIDIIVQFEGYIYPIELKYKTKQFHAIAGGESFHLKNHGAQDLGKYDYVKDICRIETFSDHIIGYKQGYAIWLTNDPYYWNEPRSSDAGYTQFSVHHGVIKEGELSWGKNMGIGSIHGREKPLTLVNKYTISWYDYSMLNAANGKFMYALITVPPKSKNTHSVL